MKARVLWCLAGASGMILCCQGAMGAYVGLFTDLAYNDGAGHDIWRVYAEFTHSADGVVACGGTAENSIHIFTSLGLQPKPTPGGSNFFNPGGTSGNTAPASGPSLNGTFVTIGIPNSTLGSGGTPGSPVDETQLSAGFPNFINGTNDFTNSDMSWFTDGLKPQGTAGYINSGFDNANRVMIMQLAVNTGQEVWGTLNIRVSVGGNEEQYDQQMFHPPVLGPAPGALTLLGMGVMVARRRRS